MTYLIKIFLLIAIAPLFCGALINDELPEQEAEQIPYPEGYRRWVHVKSALVGPESPAHARFGGLHHIYANDKAVEGYRTGRFPDGAVIVFDLLETKTKGGMTTEGRRRFIDIMHKDSKRFAETGGWGFEEFRGDGRKDKDRTIGPNAKTSCFDCHAGQKDKGFVFSSFHESEGGTK